MSAGPVIRSNDNEGRRAMAKKVRGPGGKRIGKVLKGDAEKDPRMARHLPSGRVGIATRQVGASCR